MKSTSFFIKLASLLCVCMLLLSACMIEEQSDEEAPGAAAVASELPMPEENGAETSIRELRTTMSAAPATLHPLFAMDEDTTNLLSLICEPAVKLDATDEPQPSVISGWTFDEAGTGITFKLREGVQFHGGYGEVTADDLVYALDQIMAATEQECLYARYKGTVASYSAVDSHTLQLTLTMRTAKIFNLMSFPVVPRSYYEGKPRDTKANPVGTGPYYVESYSAQEMALAQNESWWKVPSSIERVIAYAVSSNQEKVKGYQDGAYDFVALTELVPNSYGTAKNTNTYKYTTLYYETLIPNMANRYLSNRQIRQAISLCLDRREIATAGVLGCAIPTVTPVRPDAWFLEGNGSSLVEHDVTKAANLMQEAGFLRDEDGSFYVQNADGTKGRMTLKLIYCESDELYYRETVCNIIALNLQEIGIGLDIQVLDKEAYNAALAARDFDLALACFYSTADHDLNYLFGNASINNFGGYQNADIVTLINAANLATTQEEQQNAYGELNRVLAEELPHIGLYFRQYLAYASKNIEGITALRRGAAFAEIGNWS